MNQKSRRLQPKKNVQRRPGLTPRWTPLAYHPTQRAFFTTQSRFVSLPKGRRSGGTELSKRKLVLRALKGSEYTDARYFLGAPTHDQAKRIFWRDVKELIPTPLVLRINESDRCITLVNGSEIWVVGLDRPERLEGVPWDGCVITEYGNVRGEAWEEHLLPALMDRQGWAILEGVPEGRNHFFTLDQQAQKEQRDLGADSEWAAFHWRSEEILPLYGRADEVERRRRTMDAMTYEQELGASFLNWAGRAYYSFDRNLHCHKLHINPSLPLVFCFDFNVEPGTAVICQEQFLPSPASQEGTAVLDEIYVARDSNTIKICQELMRRYRDHPSEIHLYGDPAGGARATSQVQGTDWELIRKMMFANFGERAKMFVSRSAPSTRERLNATNSRFLSVDGGIRMLVDPDRAQYVVRDFEGVSRTADGNIDKKAHIVDGLTHLSDAVSYYIHERFPLDDLSAGSMSISDALKQRA